MARFLLALVACITAQHVWASNDSNDSDSNSSSSGPPETCNFGATSTFTGCTGLTTATDTKQIECPGKGNCFTESYTGTVSGCTTTVTAYGCVAAGVDCSAKKTAFETVLAKQGQVGYDCQECSTTNCNPVDAQLQSACKGFLLAESGL